MIAGEGDSLSCQPGQNVQNVAFFKAAKDIDNISIKSRPFLFGGGGEHLIPEENEALLTSSPIFHYIHV